MMLAVYLMIGFLMTFKVRYFSPSPCPPTTLILDYTLAEAGNESQLAWALLLVVPLTSYVTWDKPFTPSAPRVPHL